MPSVFSELFRDILDERLEIRLSTIHRKPNRNEKKKDNVKEDFNH